MIFLAVGWLAAAVRSSQAAIERGVQERTGSLRDQQQHLEAVVRTAAEEILTLGERGLVESMNHAPEQVFGYRSSEMVGQHVRTLIPKAGRTPFGGVLSRGVETAGTAAAGIDGRRKDGAVFPAELSFSEFVFGGRQEFVGLVRDIAVRKQADEMRNRLAAIVESANDAIISKDFAGVIGSWNAGAERLFGYTATEVVGRPVLVLVPTELLMEELDILARLRDGERIEQHQTGRLHKDGSRINVSLLMSPLRDVRGKIVGASKIARDITERTRVEAAVAAATEEERGRIARDLHDGLGQQLGGALFLSDLVQGRAGESARAAEVHSLIVHALAQAREVSRGLLPRFPGARWPDDLPPEPRRPRCPRPPHPVCLRR